jgi:hypothetical protein
MKRGSIWHLVIGVLLLLMLVARYVVAFACGHMPSMEPKNLALDGALLVYAVTRFLRYASPDLPMIKATRYVGLFLLVGYFMLKFKH